MLRVIDLLRLPSLSEAYVAAGGKGIFNVIHKFEVLEETYPSVVRFLTEHTVYLTNFWSLAEDKESRIRLIEEMISHHCAGIGIMPGVHLNNVIDPEILQLANEKSFPMMPFWASAEARNAEFSLAVRSLNSCAYICASSSR